jgi:MoxR-like ATPase
VTVGGVTHRLEDPFMVLATQNPIEMEGTYPLPEAQLDRFLMKLMVVPEGVDQLVGVITRTTGGENPEVGPVGDGETVLRMRKLAREVVLADHLKTLVARIVMATHPDHEGAPERVRRYVRYGASPRGAQAMTLAAKVIALTRGRLHVAEEDVRDVAFPTMRHRLVLNFEGEAEGLSGDDILESVLESVRA